MLALQHPSTLRLGASNGSTTIRLATLGADGPLLLTYGEQPILFTNSSHTVVYGANGSSSISLTSDSAGSSVVSFVGDVINLQAGQIGIVGNLTVNPASPAAAAESAPPPFPPPPPATPPLPPVPPPPPPSPPPPVTSVAVAIDLADAEVIQTYYANDSDSGYFTQVCNYSSCHHSSGCCMYLCALLYNRTHHCAFFVQFIHLKLAAAFK